MVAADVFLFLGADVDAKQEKLASLQQSFFPPELKEFNYTICYGDEKHLTPALFKEMLLSVPSDGAKKRLLVVRRANQLSKANLALLKAALNEGLKKLAVLLDIGDDKDSEDFVSEFLKSGAQLFRFKSEAPVNIFDLGRVIIDKNAEKALKVLANVTSRSERPEKIVGAIFWQWEKSFSGNRLSIEVYKKGLKMILEADKKLKSSSSVYARQHLILEALIVKLAYLPR